MRLMESTQSSREDGESRPPVVTGIPGMMLPMTSALAQPHHMASEPELGTRNNHTAVAAVDIHSPGASQHQNIREIDVHPVPPPVASTRPASSESLTTLGGEQGNNSPSHICSSIDSTRHPAKHRSPDSATGTTVGSGMMRAGSYRNPTLTALQPWRLMHVDPNHGGDGHTTSQYKDLVPDARGTHIGHSYSHLGE